MEGKMANPDNSDLPDNLSLKVGLGTFLGLITAGLYWAFVFPNWSHRHAQLKIAALQKRGVTPTIIAEVQRRAQRTHKLGFALKIMGTIAVVILALAFLWEIILDLGGFPIPEGPFWLFCWITLSTLALTWGSLAHELRWILNFEANIAKSCNRPWLLGGSKSRITVLVVINIVSALGLLPLVIFPPIAANAVNGYVRCTLPEGPGVEGQLIQ
jgi:hypothetical protein